MSVKRLERTKSISDAIAFSNSQFGLVRLIALACIPEGISIIVLFNSLFALRDANFMAHTLGAVIGIVVSLIIFYGAFSLAIQGSPFGSFLATAVGCGIAILGWEISFLDNVGLFKNTSVDAVLLRRVVIYLFVVGNSCLLAFLNHRLFIRNRDNIHYSREEEKSLFISFIDLRKKQTVAFIKEVVSELEEGNANGKTKTTEQPRKKRIDPNLIKSLNSLPNG